MIGKTDQANHQYDLTDFGTALKTGNLPAVSFLKAAEYQDGHAGYSDPLDEQNFLATRDQRDPEVPGLEGHRDRRRLRRLRRLVRPRSSGKVVSGSDTALDSSPPAPRPPRSRARPTAAAWARASPCW